MGSSLPWSSMQHSPSDRRVQRGPKSFRADQQRICTFVYPRISQPLPFSVLVNPVFPNAGFCFCFWIKMMQPSLVRSNDSVKPLLSSSFEILYESLTCLHSSFLCSSDKSLGTHLAQTRLIQKSSVRILKTEDLLTSLIDATSLNVRRLSFMTMS